MRPLQWLPVVRQAQIQSHQPEADLVDAEPQPWEQQRLDDGIERIELPFVVHHRQWAREQDFILPAQLLDQAEHVPVAGEPVVVELLHRPIPAGFLEPACQPAHIISRFEDGDFVSGPAQVPRCRHAAEPCSDDCNFCHGFPFYKIKFLVNSTGSTAVSGKHAKICLSNVTSFTPNSCARATNSQS